MAQADRRRGLRALRRRPQRRCPHLGDQRSQAGVIELPGSVLGPRAAFVMDRRHRHACSQQFDPPAIDHLVTGRDRHRDGPPQVIGDSHTHPTSVTSTERKTLRDPPVDCLDAPAPGFSHV